MPEQQFMLPASLLQAIINNLEEQPARASRGLLNQIEALVRQQQEAPAPAATSGQAPSDE